MPNGRKYNYKRSSRKTSTRRSTGRSARKPAQGRGAPGSAFSKRSTTLRKPATTVQRGFLPFAARYRARLPWTYFTGVTPPAASNFGCVTYRLNGPYDPDTGAGGTSAKGFSTLAGIYGRYICYGAKVVIQWADPNGDGLKLGYRVRRGNQATSSGMTLPNFTQSPFTRLNALNSTGSQKMTQSVYVPIDVPWGVRKSRLFDETEYSSTTGGNPANEVYIDVGGIDSTGVGSTSVGVTVTIVYYTVFYESTQ